MEKRINGHTRLYALIGSPVGHSGSPAMQNYSFEKLGIDAAYLAFDVNVGQTAKALEAFRTLNVGGFNVTMPCKTEAAKYMDVTKDTVRNWIKKTDIPAHKIGKLWKFKRSELDSWIKSGKSAID